MNEATVPAAPAVRPMRGAAVVALAAALFALSYYKWGGSLRAWGRVREMGKLPIDPTILTRDGALAGALAYFGKIWPAFAFGIVIGSVVRAAVPPTWVARALGGRGVKGALVGGVLGAPLMLCSCCVTPVFTGVYERGARLGSSLALMLGAPGLNLAAIALTFALLPPRLAVARAIAAVTIVVGLPALLGRMDPGRRAKAACAVMPEPTSGADFVERFVRSLLYLLAVTLPLVLVGVLGSALVLPHVAPLSGVGAVAAIGLVALGSVLVALPTFFEIPIALVMLQMGAAPGAALAVLIAGPVVNLPSLFVLGRETRPRVALAVAAGVWLVATGAGLVVTA